MNPQFSILENFPTFALPALQLSGSEVIERLGIDAVKDVIFRILTGSNVRDSTELLTRRRITTVNIGIVSLFLSALERDQDYRDTLIESAKSVISSKSPDAGELNIARWILGLTDKSVQNVLRDNAGLFDDYVKSYRSITESVVSQFEAEQEKALLSTQEKAKSGGSIDWNWFAYLANAVGTSTLTIRGSDKSTYGKLFEKLILGSLLEVLGFRLETQGEAKLSPGKFVLSTRGRRRESDATLLLDLGQAIRFDIGFIGRGNPEISLDKVTRFGSEDGIAGASRYLTTIIIVDRIGERSRIPELAEEMGGHIVQMSASYWPQRIAELVYGMMGISDELVTCSRTELPQLIKARLDDIDPSRFL